MNYPQRKKSLSLLRKAILLPLGIGLAASLLTRQSMQNFYVLNKPPLSPPPVLFPIVWTILYTLMGISFYLILTSDADKQQIWLATIFYSVQLLVNFLWPTFFFNFQWYFFSFLWLLFLWVLVAIMIVIFGTISKPAAYLNVPYIIWLTFASYLNWGIFVLN